MLRSDHSQAQPGQWATSDYFAEFMPSLSGSAPARARSSSVGLGVGWVGKDAWNAHLMRCRRCLSVAMRLLSAAPWGPSVLHLHPPPHPSHPNGSHPPMPPPVPALACSPPRGVPRKARSLRHPPCCEHHPISCSPKKGGWHTAGIHSDPLEVRSLVWRCARAGRQPLLEQPLPWPAHTMRPRAALLAAAAACTRPLLPAAGDD